MCNDIYSIDIPSIVKNTALNTGLLIIKNTLLLFLHRRWMEMEMEHEGLELR